jgi:urease accessory protein
MDWLDLLHMADSSFPTGAYAHSSGLETLAPSGVDELEHVLALRLTETLGRFELVFVLHAYAGLLVELDEQLHAMFFPREAREASSLIGTSLLRNACDVLVDARLSDFLTLGLYRHLPIAFGAVAAACTAPPELAARTYAFQHLRSLVSAAQRLGHLGQRDAQRVLHRLKPAVRQAATTATSLTPDTAGAFSPAWDIAAMRHEHERVRMFAS